jgi:adenylate cyclase class 2
MHIEIEAKLKVESHRNVAEKLRRCGAEFVADLRETDFYFDDSKSTFVKRDSCLRLRRQSGKSGEKFFLTFKGPKQKSNFKKRAELEIEVGDFNVTQKLLLVLGYKKAIVVEKKRQLWRLGGCLVLLDSVKNLGSFVEIEGPNNRKIAKVQKRLELENLKHIKNSYADLLAKKRLLKIER